MWAGYYGHEAVVMLLLDHGADANIKDKVSIIHPNLPYPTLPYPTLPYSTLIVEGPTVSTLAIHPDLAHPANTVVSFCWFR